MENHFCSASNFYHCFFPSYPYIPRRYMPYLTLLVKSLISEIRHDSPSSPFIKAVFSQFGQISTPLHRKFLTISTSVLCAIRTISSPQTEQEGGGKTETKTQTEKLGRMRKADRLTVREALVPYLFIWKALMKWLLTYKCNSCGNVIDFTAGVSHQENKIATWFNKQSWKAAPQTFYCWAHNKIKSILLK